MIDQLEFSFHMETCKSGIYGVYECALDVMLWEHVHTSNILQMTCSPGLAHVKADGFEDDSCYVTDNILLPYESVSHL